MAWIVLYYTLEVFKWLIVIRALMSWFVSPYSRNSAAEFLRRMTDPILSPISQALPRTGGFDLSPIIAFFAIVFLQQVIIRMV